MVVLCKYHCMTHYCVDHVDSDQDPYRGLVLCFVGTDPDPDLDPAQTLVQANN